MAPGATVTPHGFLHVVIRQSVGVRRTMKQQMFAMSRSLPVSKENRVPDRHMLQEFVRDWVTFRMLIIEFGDC